MRLLDVGCGWGSLSLHAAEHFGVQVLGVTLSAQQHEFISKRIAERGLGDRVEVRLQDYRELREPAFDAVTSIEMGEHVGEDNYPVYAGTLFGRLRPGGRLLLQQMSRRADAAPGGGAFIETYIAPDMHMRPLGDTLASWSGPASRSATCRRCASTTCARSPTGWHLRGALATAVALVGEEVARVWRLYLVGGGLTFEEGRMGVDQILAVRPFRPASQGCRSPRSGRLPDERSADRPRWAAAAADPNGFAGGLRRHGGARGRGGAVRPAAHLPGRSAGRPAQRYRHRLGAAVLCRGGGGLRPLGRPRRRTAAGCCCSP